MPCAVSVFYCPAGHIRGHVIRCRPADLLVLLLLLLQVLGHLNQKRPISTRREEFYLQADAFAVLSEMDFVGIDGAVQIVAGLLCRCDALLL